MEPIAGYEHGSGDHCGSTSLSNLAAFYDWNLDEPACLGIGSGLGFTYFEPGESPWRVFFGRPMWVERAFFEHLGIEFEEYQSVPVERFREAVTTDHVYPLDAEYFVVTDPEPTTDLGEAMRVAVAETANYMLDPASASRSLGRSPVGEGTHGIEGIRAFAEELPEFTTLPDPSWAVHFAYQTVELRGTGGGAFRRLYADFLELAAAEVPEIPDNAGRRLRAVADDWTAVGHLLKETSQCEDPEAMREDLELASEELDGIADREAAVFEDVAGVAASSPPTS